MIIIQALVKQHRCELTGHYRYYAWAYCEITKDHVPFAGGSVERGAHPDGGSGDATGLDVTAVYFIAVKNFHWNKALERLRFLEHPICLTLNAPVLASPSPCAKSNFHEPPHCAHLLKSDRRCVAHYVLTSHSVFWKQSQVRLKRSSIDWLTGTFPLFKVCSRSAMFVPNAL